MDLPRSARNKEQCLGTAIARIPRSTTARSATSMLRGSSSPILIASLAQTSCESAPQPNRSSPPLWPLIGHPFPAHLPSPDPCRWSHIVDTLSRDNYVGMWGLGEICAQSGATDAMNNNGVGLPLGQHAGIFYRNSATTV